jgi:RNA polymerase-binding transcription factor DksA
MAAVSEVSRRGGRVDHAALSTRHAERLRARLIAGMAEQSTQLAQHEAALAASISRSCAEVVHRDRALAALHMYVAREAMEEIDAALARIDDGSYGTCQSCERPIPLERLETMPAARFCPACPAPRWDPPAGGGRDEAMAPAEIAAGAGSRIRCDSHLTPLSRCSPAEEANRDAAAS